MQRLHVGCAGRFPAFQQPPFPLRIGERRFGGLTGRGNDDDAGLFAAGQLDEPPADGIRNLSADAPQSETSSRTRDAWRRFMATRNSSDGFQLD